MQDALGKARARGVARCFQAARSRSRADFKLGSGVTGNDAVVVSYPDAAIGKDKDGPILRTDSEPKKGSKVKAGDTIKVTIKASERFEDGHKSWPSGVRSIQLLANDGKAERQGLRNEAAALRAPV